MRKFIHLIGILSIITAVMSWVVSCSNEVGLRPTPKVLISPGLEPKSKHPFDNQVAKWARELENIPPPPGAKDGNCMPFAEEIQKRIVATGRPALIVIVDPVPDDEELHAMVMYSNEKSGRFNRLIDNGYLTKFFPKDSKGLYERKYGKYEGVCREPKGNTCRVDEPF